MSDWHPARIVMEVRLKGSNLTKIALANHLSPATVRTALRRPSCRAEKAIISFLEVAPQEIWPSRYNAQGERIVTRGRSSRAKRGFASRLSRRKRSVARPAVRP